MNASNRIPLAILLAVAAGVAVTLVNPSPPVLKAIQVTGLSEVFGLTD